jgi:ATP-dependent 26S proteasome regulatory subunit
MNLTRGINLRKIAEMMPGASGAEVKVWEIKINENDQV